MVALLDKFVLSWFMLGTIFVTLQMMNDVEAFYLIPKVHVGITNILRVQVSFHCKDKTRDDGFHTLPPDQTYRFGFKTDIFLEKTLWFCQFTWQRERQESHYFDIYVATRDNSSDVNWYILDTGPCKIFNPIKGASLCYPWNDKQQHELQGGKKLLNSNTTTQQEPPLS
ncbi:hypothetical protein Lal_00033302 [Lupinus albus]|uniref:S-protein homolog n=1 Tax=Lupinus albus TaxID=3870 RepID=A0A6A4QFC8_LUPAL|nr:putative plant self-incompatibility S1 [Lupinus albus]KAF1879644.1 hypothetical protein Lal_00033302 [Lupinus albus]